MDRRRLLLILAVFVAVIGTALVFLYVKGADGRAKSQFANVSVLQGDAEHRRRRDVRLRPGRRQDRRSGQVPAERGLRERGRQTSTTQLKGTIASVPIFAGQQIIASQFGDSVAAATQQPGRSPRG